MPANPSTAFASDNAAPAHPAVLDAVVAANQGNAPAYGNDPLTQRAADLLRDVFESPDARVLFAFTGTGANIIALASAVRQWNSILTSDIAHALLDEAGGPVRISGASLLPLPSDGGIIETSSLDEAVSMRGDVHHPQPRIVSITQSTEEGRVWDVDTLNRFITHAHHNDLLVHVDGSRIANAVAALQISPREAIGDADIVTVGGTKNGMLFGDAILVRTPQHFDGIEFVQKQIGHLASKHRYVAAQFDALFHDDIWLRNAAHANAMAARLSAGMTALGLELAAPTEANEVFVYLPPDVAKKTRQRFAIHQPEPLRSIYRFVCSWVTTADEVVDALETVRQALG